MADEIYSVPDDPTYDPDVRKLQDSDPARASTTFNPVIQQMIENTHYVKLKSDQLADAVEDVANGLFKLEITFDSSFSGKAFTVTGGGFSYSGTVPGELVATVAVPEPNTVYTVTCQTMTNTVETANYFGIYAVDMAVLADATWAQIAAVAAAGNASSNWSVGDTKDITLTTGETLTLMIYGFNLDDLTSGSKAPITFGLKNLMGATRQMEASDINTNGFTGSAMYTWLTDTLYPTLPADLRAVIKPVTKKTSAGGQSTTILSETMSVFLFSEIECFGTRTYSVAGEGTQYPVFTNAASRIKCLTNGAGAAGTWWERSPRSTNSISFCYVINTGTANGSLASSACGVCFGFCI